MERFGKYLIGGMLIIGTAFLAGGNSNCEVNSDFDGDDGFDFDDDDGFFKPIIGDKDQSPNMLAMRLPLLFPNA